jgi:hypothetical protein
MTQMALRVGWKEICKLLGCKDIRTARKWAKNFSMPLIWVYGRPTILDTRFESWWEKVEKKLMQRKH